MIPGLDPLNIILLVVAVIVLWRLKSVLGTRTGLEKPPFDPFPKPAERNPENDNVIHLPGSKDAADDRSVPESMTPVWTGHAAEGSAVALGLEAIDKATPGFNASQFVGGAKVAYEMVLEAYAAGDKTALKGLLGKDVFDSFSGAIDQRLKNGEKMVFQFVGVRTSEITAARLDGRRASITVRFLSDMVNGIVDKTGETVTGDPKSIQDVTDVWTFERDVTARDPNWKLVATDDPAG